MTSAPASSGGPIAARAHFSTARGWIRRPAERRARDGRLELLGIESADPRWVAASIDGLLSSAHRLRALGTVASTLCQVAAARFDGMVTLRRSRGVDAAAGQLIVREAGGLISFTDCPEPLAAPMDASPTSHLVAARSAESLRELERIVRVSGSRAETDHRGSGGVSNRTPS